MGHEIVDLHHMAIHSGHFNVFFKNWLGCDSILNQIKMLQRHFGQQHTNDDSIALDLIDYVFQFQDALVDYNPSQPLTQQIRDLVHKITTVVGEMHLHYVRYVLIGT